MAMCIPHVGEELFMAAVSWGAVPTVKRLVKGGFASLLLLVGPLGIPSHRGTEPKDSLWCACVGWHCRNRFLRLPKTRDRSSEHCALQCFQRPGKGPKYLRHRTVVVLPGEFDAQFQSAATSRVDECSIPSKKKKSTSMPQRAKC